tara:strand:+ start:1155 stop:1619 length:465 start_codon:yes stop_codon:yes gene_type:complete
MYDIKSKFAKNSPLPCWKGYERVPGTAQGAKGSCRKSSPARKYVSDAQRKAVWASKADGGKGNPNKMLSPLTKKQKGGGTRKTCLPASKIASMSKKERASLVAAKQKSGKAGKYKRSSKTNVKGARKKGATLRDWFQKEDWRQVNNPSKKCGEK